MRSLSLLSPTGLCQLIYCRRIAFVLALVIICATEKCLSQRAFNDERVIVSFPRDIPVEQRSDLVDKTEVRTINSCIRGGIELFKMPSLRFIAFIKTFAHTEAN